MTAQAFDWKVAAFGMRLKKGASQRRLKALVGVSTSEFMHFKRKSYAVISALCSRLRLHCETSGAIKTAFCGIGRPLKKLCGRETCIVGVFRFAAFVRQSGSLAGAKSVCGNDDRFSLKSSRWGAETALDVFVC